MEKNNSYKIDWETSIHGTHGYLHHLKILSSIPFVNDSPLIFKNMPVLFTSTKNYSASNSLFHKAIYEIATDDADELFHSKNSCTNHDCRIGGYCFCEATKVDLAEPEDKRQKKHFQKKKNQLSSTLSTIVCLLCALFEDLGCAIELHEKIANEVLSYILWTREIISLMDKKKEITFFGKESSMKQVSMTRNIYSCMNHGVCLPTESSINIYL